MIQKTQMHRSEKELKRELDQLASEKTKFLLRKEKRPWYNEEVAIMKRALRKSEKSG